MMAHMWLHKTWGSTGQGMPKGGHWRGSTQTKRAKPVLKDHLLACYKASKLLVLSLRIRELLICRPGSQRAGWLLSFVDGMIGTVEQMVMEVADLADLGQWILLVKQPTGTMNHEQLSAVAEQALKWSKRLQAKHRAKKRGMWVAWVTKSLEKGAGVAHKWTKQAQHAAPVSRQLDARVVALSAQKFALRSSRWGQV